MENKKILVELSERELRHLINDTISRIYKIKELVFGEYWNFGTNITEVETLNEKQTRDLNDLGYYSRKELLDKLLKIERDNFQQFTCCRG